MNFELECELGLEQCHEIEINLSTAQKYLTKLKSHQKSVSGMSDSYGSGRRSQASSVNYATLDVSNIAKITDMEKFCVDVNVQADKVKEERNSLRNISYDIINIKNLVHKQNSKIGLDEILSSIDFLNAELTNWKTIESASKNFLNISGASQLKTAFDTAKAESNNGKTPIYPTMYVSIYDSITIKNKIKLVTERIHFLEESRDKLNVNNLIKVKLSTQSIETLGIALKN